MENNEKINSLIAELRDVFPFPEEKDWDKGYDWEKKDGWHTAGLLKSPENCLEIMIGVCKGMKNEMKKK